jgi:hypothetical protein
MSSLAPWERELLESGPEGGVIVVPPDQGRVVGDLLVANADEQMHQVRMADKTYRVVGLNERKTVATGLSLAAAHRFIEDTRAVTPQARFDIRTEIAS